MGCNTGFKNFLIVVVVVVVVVKREMRSTARASFAAINTRRRSSSAILSHSWRLLCFYIGEYEGEVCDAVETSCGFLFAARRTRGNVDVVNSTSSRERGHGHPQGPEGFARTRATARPRRIQPDSSGPFSFSGGGDMEHVEMDAEQGYVDFDGAELLTGYAKASFRDERVRRKLNLTLFRIGPTGALRLSRAELLRLVVKAER